jgi:hypothetical protein
MYLNILLMQRLSFDIFTILIYSFYKKDHRLEPDPTDNSQPYSLCRREEVKVKTDAIICHRVGFNLKDVNSINFEI